MARHAGCTSVSLDVKISGRVRWVFKTMGAASSGARGARCIGFGVHGLENMASQKPRLMLIRASGSVATVAMVATVASKGRIWRRIEDL